jgi:hypothetical protein
MYIYCFRYMRKDKCPSQTQLEDWNFDDIQRLISIMVLDHLNPNGVFITKCRYTNHGDHSYKYTYIYLKMLCI